MKPLLSAWAGSVFELVIAAIAGVAVSAPIGAVALARTPYAEVRAATPPVAVDAKREAAERRPTTASETGPAFASRAGRRP